MYPSRNLQEKHQWFLFLYTILAIMIIGVFRHGTTLLYLILWGYLFFIQKQPLKTLKTAALFAQRPPFVFLTLLIGWGVISTLWSIFPNGTLTQSLVNLVTFASFAIFFAVLIKQDILASERMVKYIIIIFGISLAILLMQELSQHTVRYWLHHSYRGLKPNAEVISILALPIIAFFIYQKKYGWAGLVYTATLFLTYSVQIRTSFIAMIIGGIAALCFYLAPRLMILFSTMGSIIYTLVFPWLFLFDTPLQSFFQSSFIPQSFLHRFFIWTFVAHKIKEKFWLGWGMATSHYFPGGQEKIAQYDLSQLPSHPHNEVMQIWLEQGFVGAFLLACFHGTLFWQLRKLPSRLSISMVGFFLISVLIMLAMSHSVWHKWWITWIALCGGLILSVTASYTKGLYLKKE